MTKQEIRLNEYIDDGPINIPEDVIKTTIDGFSENYSGIKRDLTNSIRTFLSQERVRERINELDRLFDIDNKTILEIGSGSGLQVATLLKKGINCYGIEPDSDFHRASHILLQKNNIDKERIIKSIGEDLPFKEEKFDLIVSYQVIEHTIDPQKVINECYRVLKKGGYLFSIIPNYASFWEGHYAIFWIPKMPRIFAKIYVKILGRDSKFINSIHFITPGKVVKYLNNANFSILCLGKDAWEHRLKEGIDNYWGSTAKLKPIIKLINTLRINSFVSFLGKKLNFFYPIIVKAKK